MAGTYIIPDDVDVRGNLQCESFTPPNDSIGNPAWDANEPLEAVNQQHQHHVTYRQKDGASVASETMPIHHAYDDGEVVEVRVAVLTAALTTSTVTINILKNGVTSIFNATFQVTAALLAHVKLLATLHSSNKIYVADDVFEIVITVAGGGTPPQGMIVTMILREGAGS